MGNANFTMGNTKNKNINYEEDHPLKTKEELIEEEKQNQQKIKNFIKENAIIINMHKEMVKQRNLNTSFRVKLPIQSIKNIPVEVYLVFSEKDINKYHFMEYYDIELCIYPKWDLAKNLYKAKLSRRDGEMLELVNINNFGNEWYYRSWTINGLRMYFNLSIDIINNLNLDTYMECFTESIMDHNYSSLLNNKKYTNIIFETVYSCEICYGQTKNEDSICYFCKHKKKDG